MTLTFPRLLAAAWLLFRRDRALIGPLAGCLIFLPTFAVLLLCDPVPPLPPAPRDQAMLSAWMDAVGIWAQANALPYVMADLLAILGGAAIALLLLDPQRLSVGAALRAAGARFLPFALVSLLAAVPVGLGLWLLILPGLYAQARLVVATPVLARHGRAGPFAALGLSVRLTRGQGLAITGAIVALFLTQWLAVVPLMSADEWLRGAGRTNPFVLSVVDAAIAGLGAAYHVAVLLVGVVVYRVRASSGT